MKAKLFLLTILLLVLSVCSPALAQAPKGLPSLQPPVKALAAIRESDLQNDLYAMTDDHFRGREAGTLDELKVSMWLANQMKKAGLEPAGDDSTYFQFFTLWRNRISRSSRIRAGDSLLTTWRDVLVATIAPAEVLAPLVYAGTAGKAVLDTLDIRGKAVVIEPSSEGINENVSLFERRYPGYILRKYGEELTRRGAAAIIFIAGEAAEKSWSQVLPAMQRGLYDIEGGPNEKILPRVPVFWVHTSAAPLFKRKGTMFTANILMERFEYPSVNVVGKIRGTDPVLSKEWVLFSGHQDHDGIRQPYGDDSIYNGADDNGSVSVALLAIARAFHQTPGRRSALFVWHGAEERGLLGSKWFAAHPTVPKESIVAVLNGDMIGRNNADSAALLGRIAPHRNSADLVQMALDANKEGPAFKLDTLWDQTDHVEGWYFRSDHLPYARAGIPAVFFTTLLHLDYHTPMDEAKRINIRKLAKVTAWMYRTGWKAANAGKRPATEPGFKLER